MKRLAPLALALVAAVALVIVSKRERDVRVDPHARIVTPSTHRGAVAEPATPIESLCAEAPAEREAVRGTNDSVDEAVPETHDELADELETVFETFRTRAPDFDGWRALVHSLAARAVVVEGSVTEHGAGEFDGRLAFRDSNLTGAFQVAYGIYVVSLTNLRRPADDAWISRTFSFSFSDEDSAIESGWATVQFHPRADFFVGGEGQTNTIVGWNAGTSRSGGTIATPIQAVRAQAGGAIRVGPVEFNSIERPWDWDVRPFEAWWTVLRRD